MKNYLIVLITPLIFSCSKKNPENNSFLFEFDNHYFIEGSNEFVETNKGYIDTIFQRISTFIHLNNGEIMDTLVYSCGNWNYTVNPSSTVKIWFPKSIKNGIYRYSRAANINDFEINIRRNISFGPIYQFGLISYPNSILNSDDLANSSSSIGSHNLVDYAVIKIQNLNEENSILRYIVSTSNGEIIKGSYRGDLENFRYLIYEGDCD